MTTTITERDKKLLYILAMVLVLVLGYRFALVPSFDKYKDIKLANNTLVEQQEKMETEISKINAYKKNLSVANDNYKKTSDKVFGKLSAAGVDGAMTKLIQDNGLSPMTLNISDINKIKISNFVVPKPVSNNPNQKANEQMGVIADESSLVTAANVDIVATGSEEGVKALAMAMSNEVGIFVQTLDLSLSGDSSTIKATVSMILSDI